MCPDRLVPIGSRERIAVNKTVAEEGNVKRLRLVEEAERVDLGASSPPPIALLEERYPDARRLSQSTSLSRPPSGGWHRAGGGR